MITTAVETTAAIIGVESLFWDETGIPDFPDEFEEVLVVAELVVNELPEEIVSVEAPLDPVVAVLAVVADPVVEELAVVVADPVVVVLVVVPLGAVVVLVVSVAELVVVVVEVVAPVLTAPQFATWMVTLVEF